MKKNKMMRLASVLLVLVLMTTCVIGGTFAKYTTTVSSSDKARVAYWGFQSSNSMNLTGLFADTYDGTVDSVNNDDVIAPGTSGSTTFSFAWDENVSAYGSPVTVTGPEVAYTFTVAVEGTIDPLIANNQNIQWKLDNGEWGNWDAMVTAIKNLSGEADGTKEYGPNELPVAFTATDDIHTIAWQWIFDGGNAKYNVENNNKPLDQDQYDTYMGNVNDLGDVSLQITITATQIN